MPLLSLSLVVQLISSKLLDIPLHRVPQRIPPPAGNMKFTNGIWFDREHTQIYNAVEVSDVTHPRDNEIKVLCTTRHIIYGTEGTL